MHPTYLNDSNFSTIVKNLIQKYNIKSVVETGTGDGRGSTSVFASTGIPVYTIECNDVNISLAKKNLENSQNVVVFHGYSLNYCDMISFIISNEFKYGFNIKEDYKVNTKPKYLRELTYSTTAIRENILPSLCCNIQKQIIFLDSAGGMGYLECQVVLSTLTKDQIKSKILILDDVNHVKHYHSVKLIRSLGYPWMDCGRFGYSIFAEKPC